MQIGDKFENTIVTKEVHSARHLGSGGLEVFATPAMVAGMENVSFLLCEKSMESGNTTVGISLDLAHTKATKIGDSVTFKCEIMQIEGKKITLFVEAFDSKGQIGKGTHERFVVSTEKFISRL